MIWPVSRIDEWLDAELRAGKPRSSEPRGSGSGTPTRAQAPAPGPRPMFLRPSEVARMIGVSRGTLYRWARHGVFPPPVRLSGMTSGWTASVVEDWIARKASKEAITEPDEGPSGVARPG